MGIFKEILDTINDIGNLGSSKVEDAFKSKRYRSIAQRSMEGTLQFPTIVTKSLDIETLQMVSKALERQYASFVQVSLSMSPFLDLKKDKNAAGYLRKFHQNSHIKTNLTDIMNVASDVLESYTGYSDEANDKLVFATVTEGATNQIVSANKQQLESVLEGIREDILNNKFIPSPDKYRFKNDELSRHHNTVVTETTITEKNTPSVYSLPNQVLKDNEVRKSNELIPTTMHVRTILMNQESEAQGTLDFIIGIKTTMHQVASDEIISNLVSGVKTKNKFFNTIRWTTGEISFFKDFLFNIKEIKDDVSKRSSGSSPWWISLKRRKAMSKLTNNVMLANKMLPNATIVVSMEEVEYIKSEYGYDLMSPSFTDKLMSEYFLLGFVVVDNSTQITHFLFDGQQNYQSVSFSGLESANRSGSGVDFKDVLKLVQRV